ncbi:hypothetical protein ASG90_16020 [Nocardioides sp. Soil797]|nr:hypothetical protein ASG90_16020 [Nocardioides sp. Soil797]
MSRHKWEPWCPFPNDLVTPVQIDPTGRDGPTRGQATGDAWRWVAEGLYVPAAADVSKPEQRILEAAQRLPLGAAVTAWASCRWQGVSLLDGLGRDGRTPLPVPLLVGNRGQVRRDAGVRVSYERLRPWEVWNRNGLLVTRPEKAVWDEMRRQPNFREALVVLEMVLAAGLTSLQRVAAYAEAHRSDRQAKRIWPALEMASEHSRSPQEVRLRTTAELDAGLPRLLVNCPIHTREGRLLGIADLLDLEAGLAIEYDGADHREIERHTVDVKKDDQFRRRGLELVRITGTDLRNTSLVTDRLRAARNRSAFEPVADRLWVPVPPQDTNEAELQLKESQAMLHAWWHSLEFAS